VPGDFFSDGSVNRAVPVDSRAVIEALRVVHGAESLIVELQQASALSTAQMQ
jgi:hypothetical protein